MSNPLYLFIIAGDYLASHFSPLTYQLSKGLSRQTPPLQYVSFRSPFGTGESI